MDFLHLLFKCGNFRKLVCSTILWLGNNGARGTYMISRIPGHMQAASSANGMCEVVMQKGLAAAEQSNFLGRQGKRLADGPAAPAGGSWQASPGSKASAAAASVVKVNPATSKVYERRRENRMICRPPVLSLLYQAELASLNPAALRVLERAESVGYHLRGCN